MSKQEKNQKELSWFKRGEEGFTAKRQSNMIAQSRKERGIHRFWLKAGEEAVLIFCDDEPFFIYEHNLEIGNTWGNFITCVKELKPCPICDRGFKSTYTAYFTVVDTRGFTKKDGTKVKESLVLYPAKGASILKLEDIKKKRKSLVGLAIKVKRYTKEEPNCGSDFEVLKKVNTSKINTKPYDYVKILAPLSEEELAGYGFGDNIVNEQSGEEISSSLKDLI